MELVRTNVHRLKDIIETVVRHTEMDLSDAQFVMLSLSMRGIGVHAVTIELEQSRGIRKSWCLLNE